METSHSPNLDLINMQYDINIQKAFDIKFKPGHSIVYANIDENDYWTTLYFLKNFRVYSIDISSQKCEELSFTKNHDVVYITSNTLNTILIILFKNGKIFGFNIKTKQIFFFKNFQIDIKTQNILTMKIFVNDNLSKVVAFNEEQITIWYDLNRNLKVASDNTNKNVNELLGFHIYIQIKEEIKSLLKLDKFDFDNSFFNTNVLTVFGNNLFCGSNWQVFYLWLFPNDINGEKKMITSYKLVLIDYWILFEKENAMYLIDHDINNKHEYKTKFHSKYLYSYIVNINEPVLSSAQTIMSTKNKIISKANKASNCIAIAINFTIEQEKILLLWHTETYKFQSFSPFSWFPNKNIHRKIEDIAWLCNDCFILVSFTFGYFVILNANFNVVTIWDISKEWMKYDKIDYIYIHKSFYANKENELALKDNYKVISANKSDYFAIYSSNMIIGYKLKTKGNQYISKIIENEILNFNDWWYNIRIFQTTKMTEEVKIDLISKIHSYIIVYFADIFTKDIDMIYNNEGVSWIIKIFVEFILIYRNVNYWHEDNLTLLTYLIGIANDFFSYLLKHREIWLCFLFVEWTEKYVLNHFRLKNIKNKQDDAQFARNRVSYLIFNPLSITNISLRCYNKITNFTILSRSRLILFIYSLIEFHNSQALNINVLYFILAKKCINKLIKHNLLDDVHLILKVIIRNWKYLKSENVKAGGEEYVLNGITMNYRTELWSQFIHTKISHNIDGVYIDFFSDFYSIEDLHNYNKVNNYYCSGEETNLITEYNYWNNIGVIQKWIWLFNNSLFADTFDAIKEYWNNHFKQTISNTIKKNPDNISPDELNLTRWIYFNIFFFSWCLIQFIETSLELFIERTEFKGGNSANKKRIKFISPVDIPFLIFEFYSDEDGTIRDTPGIDIQNNWKDKINRYFKETTNTIHNFLDFTEFLLLNGFKMYSDNINIEIIEDSSNSDDSISNNSSLNNSIQQSIFSVLLFYLFLCHKNSTLFLLELDNVKFLNYLTLLSPVLNRELLELLLLILNGRYRYLVYKTWKLIAIKTNNKKVEDDNITTDNEMIIKDINANIRLILFYIRDAFSTYLNNEINYAGLSQTNFVVELVQSVPDPIMLPWWENAIESQFVHIYNNYKNIITSIENMSSISVLNSAGKVGNIFDIFCKDNISNNMFDIIIPNCTKKQKSKFQNYLSTTVQLLLLKENFIIFNVKDEAFLKGVTGKETKEELINILITGTIDKQSKVLKKLITSVKSKAMKLLVFLNIIYLKYKILTHDHMGDPLNYMKLFSYLLIIHRYNRKDGICEYHVQNILRNWIPYLTTRHEEGTEDAKKDILKKSVDILLNWSYLIAVYSGVLINEDIKMLISKVENLVQKINKNVFNDYKDKLCSQVKSIGKFENKKLWIILWHTPLFGKINTVVINQMKTYTAKMLKKNKLPMQLVREKYELYAENFSNWTWINSNNIIEFNSCWEISFNSWLYTMIATDKFTGTGYQNQNHSEFLITSRQKHMKKTAHKTQWYEKLLNKWMNKSMTQPDVTIPTESIIIEPVQTTTPIKIVNAELENTIVDNWDNTNNNNDDINFSDFFKMNANERKIPKRRRWTKIEKLVNYIKRVFFSRFLFILFQKYKREITGKELEVINIINIEPKTGKVEISKIQEKYLSTLDIDKALKHEDYTKINSLKAFDVINVNKFIQGNSENSKIYKELIKEKKTKKIAEKLKAKIEEMKTKWLNYEKKVGEITEDFKNHWSQ